MIDVMCSEEQWNRAAFDRWQAFCESARGQQVMFLWAFCEAIFFPVIPDALLVPMAAGGRGKYWRILGAAVLGSALGGIITYLFSYHAPVPAQAVLLHLPMIQGFMLVNVQSALDQQGLAAFWTQPWSGISYKIYAVLAAGRGWNPLWVIPISIVARALRMFVNSAIVALATRWVPNFFRNFWLYLVITYIILFFYGWWQLST